MKRQDSQPIPPQLEDQSGLKETILFKGEIEDDDFLHVLRLFCDEHTNGLRLEASVAEGQMKNMPVWTAFITNDFNSRGWLQWSQDRIIRLRDLRPYVFIEDYTPPRARTGAFELSFTRKSYAEHFVHAIHALSPQ
ncbi:hypothetical protein H2203_000136 [Taxawa tesnikishii (nom. ined.)]|nr:hypothetical protein H2203_000136 [Dothideales sp. JES 119]